MQLLYIAGPARSGTTILAALLDDHPDIAVWPREWHYFTSFWQSLPGESERKPMQDVTRAALSMLRKAAAPVAYDHVGEFRNDGALDLGVMVTELEKGPDAPVSAPEYLLRLGKAFTKAHRLYRDREPRYFAVKTMMTGIDWSQTAHMREARTLFTVRPLEDAYRSHKSKFFDLPASNAVSRERRTYQYFRDWCYPLLYFAKQTLDVRRRLERDDAARLVSLTDLRRSAETVMRDIADFLDVPFHSALLTPSFLGVAYAGHFYDRSLNRGQILDAETAYPALSAFEDHYFARLDHAYLMGQSLESLGSFARRIRNAARTSADTCPRHLGFRALTFANLVGVDHQLARIWQRDLSGAPHRADMLLRTPRGYKTRLTRSARRVLENISPS